MLRHALVAAALLALFAPVAAADLPLCERGGICPILVFDWPPLYACAGLGVGLQGAKVCVYQGAVDQPCVEVTVGFHVRDTCDPIDLP